MAARVKSRIADGVGHLTLANADRRNALSADLVEEAFAVHREFEDAGLRVGVLAAEGPVFCAGGDLKEKRIPGVTPAGLRLIEAFDTSPLLWIAAIQGPALGAALQLISVCPRAVMASDAWLCLPELQHGRFPRPVVAAMAGAIGPRRAMRMAMTGEKMGAAEALSVGFVERVVDAAELEKVVEEEAVALARVDADALTAARLAWRTRLGTREAG
jgi:enoyl-CoA hydratase/carnithine racemase